MSGVPNALYFRLRNTLLECGPFNSNEQLRDIFANTLIIPWRNQLRDATSRDERVDALITLLMDRHRIDIQTNALVLFLGILRDRTDPATSCYHQLTSVMKDLDAAFQVNSPSGPPRSLEEANPQNQPMMFTADLIRLVESIEAVGKVNVPKIVHGKVANQFLSGTGWLITPTLALTCWHVIKARGPLDDDMEEADLQAQVKNSTVVFDYTLPGQGVEYGISELECYDPDLDYALVRLEDRADHPLARRGFLRIEEDIPLKLQTALYIIQHPKGQPQQNSSGFFKKYKTGQPNHILHSAPTEQGTSGAPVVNVVNWNVVGLHTGEDMNEYLREATLLKAILSHIRQVRPDLYSNLVDIH